MRLIIKNKLISIGGGSKVLDEDNNPKYVVKGKLFTLTGKKKIYDMEHNLLYVVRNKFWHFLFNRYAYISDAEGNRLARIKLKFGINKRFFIEGFQDEISVEGNFWGWNYSIYKNGEIIGSLSRKLDFTDCFILDIEKEEEMSFLVAIVIGIDNIFDKARANND